MPNYSYGSLLQTERYTDLAQWRLDVKDERGELLLSVLFEESAA